MQPRRPITVVLDRVCRPYNIGAIFRLCDAFLVEKLIIGGAPVELHKRKLVQAARGTHYWVPWEHVDDPIMAVVAAKSAGLRIIAVEQTSKALPPEVITDTSPTCIVLGSERDGVSQDILDMADLAVSIPMSGFANSINVATAAAIVIHRLSGVLPNSLSSPTNA